MAFVRDLILGEREPSQFEDDVRALLGEPAALRVASSLQQSLDETNHPHSLS